jgi:hypothetical protein
VALAFDSEVAGGIGRGTAGAAAAAAAAVDQASSCISAFATLSRGSAAHWLSITAYELSEAFFINHIMSGPANHITSQNRMTALYCVLI